MVKRWVVFLGVFLLFLTSCSGDSGGTFIWIDAPINPTNLTEVNPITIEGHATSPDGIAQIEVWVNGTMVDTIHSPAMADNLAKFESSFSPSGPGEYVVQVVATGTNGVVSEPDNTIINIGETVAEVPEPDTVVEDPTPVPTPTDTPTPVPEDDSPVVNFWADPAEIEAGGCTTIYWEVSNVSKVEFGGRKQEFSGSYYDCMCESQTYPMKVTYEDGTDETLRVTIEVNGECETPDPPTPVSDTTAPAAPTPLKPLNGEDLSCTYNLMLRWSEVTDPSGIQEYQVRVEWHSGDNNWQPLTGSIFEHISATEKEITVDCGYYFRFQVRAADKAGNVSNWSQWFYFNVLLG